MTQESTTPPVDEVKEQPAEQPAPEVQELNLMLEDARNKADEHWNQMLRVQAEMENLRRRARSLCLKRPGRFRSISRS